MTDNINHPAHYTAYRGIEVIDLTEQLNFNRGNAVKYIARAGLKDPEKTVEDLQKARWYIDREINRVSTERDEAAKAKEFSEVLDEMTEYTKKLMSDSEMNTVRGGSVQTLTNPAVFGGTIDSTGRISTNRDHKS